MSNKIEPYISAEKGDVILFRGNALLSKLIRRFSTTPSDKLPTIFNHVGIAVGTYSMVEAMSKVVVSSIARRATEEGQQVMIARLVGTVLTERDSLSFWATNQVGRKYGWVKVIEHLGDYWLSKMRGKDVYFFRRLHGTGRYPICSWLVGFDYFKNVGHFRFNGIQPEYCTPDDIGDDILEGKRGRWEIVYCNPRLEAELKEAGYERFRT
jgi:hypothetical protein